MANTLLPAPRNEKSQPRFPLLAAGAVVLLTAGLFTTACQGNLDGGNGGRTASPQTPTPQPPPVIQPPPIYPPTVTPPAPVPQPPPAQPTPAPVPQPPPTPQPTPPPTPTPTPTPPNPGPPPGMKEALLVVGNAQNLAAGDDELQQILEEDLQFLVDVADDQDDKFRDVVNPGITGIIVISSSANANQMDNGYFRSNIPALVMNDDAFPLYEMTDDGNQDARTVNARELVVLDDTHPITKSLGGRGGRIDITLDRQNVAVIVGRPEQRTAQILVGANNSRSEAAVFVYEPGVELARVGNSRSSRLASNRLVGFFARENFMEDLDPSAFDLLKNSILYTWNGTGQ